MCNIVPDFDNDTYILARRHLVEDVNIPLLKGKVKLYFDTVKKFKTLLGDI